MYRSRVLFTPPRASVDRFFANLETRKKTPEMAEPRASSAPEFDFYEALEVEKTADAAEIKSQYRKLALKYHPDKNGGDATNFKRVSVAYKILSDPTKRAEYDAHGVDGIDKTDILDTEIDISEAGFANTLMASMISSLGVNIKTAVPMKVLEAVRSGAVAIASAQVGCKMSENVKKGEIRLFRCRLTEEDTRAGVVVSVVSPAGDKFKLLHFAEGNGVAGKGLELSLQEMSAKFDSVKPKRSHAGFYFSGTQSFNYEPMNAVKLSKLESRDFALFHALDNWTPRECTTITPGEHVFGVYGDNFFDKCKFEFEIFTLGTKVRSPAAGGDSEYLEINAIREIESKLSHKKDELMRFEKEYAAAKAAFEKVVIRHQKENEEIRDLLAAREAAYCALTLPGAAAESEDSSSAFTLPTIDTSAFKNFSFSNPFAKK